MFNINIISLFVPSNTSKIAVGVSGGADSMFLACILNEWCNKNSVNLIAYIVDHKIRPESTLEAEMVKTRLQNFGIESVILSIDNFDKKSNIQHEARLIRFKLFYNQAQVDGISNLFLAHTQNDQAETVLMRIIRGSSIKGIAGIRSISYYKSLKLIRPLLNTTRQYVERYLSHKGWVWVNDPSNSNIKYDRVKVRKLLANHNELFGDDRIYQRLNLISVNALSAYSYIKSRVNLIWKKKVQVTEFNVLVIDNSIYKLHQEIIYGIIQKALYYFNKQRPIRQKSILNLIIRLKSRINSNSTLNKCIIRKKLDKTYIFFEYTENKLNSNSNFRISNILANYKIKIDQTALSIRFIGKKGWQMLKKDQFKKSCFIPIEAMYCLIGIYKDNKLIAIPQLNLKFDV